MIMGKGWSFWKIAPLNAALKTDLIGVHVSPRPLSTLLAGSTREMSASRNSLCKGIYTKDRRPTRREIPARWLLDALILIITVLAGPGHLNNWTSNSCPGTHLGMRPQGSQCHSRRVARRPCKERSLKKPPHRMVRDKAHG